MRSLTPYIQSSTEEARVGQRLVLEPHGSDVGTVALGGQGQLWSRIALKVAGSPVGPQRRWNICICFAWLSIFTLFFPFLFYFSYFSSFPQRTTFQLQVTASSHPRGCRK